MPFAGSCSGCGNRWYKPAPLRSCPQCATRVRICHQLIPEAEATAKFNRLIKEVKHHRNKNSRRDSRTHPYIVTQERLDEWQEVYESLCYTGSNTWIAKFEGFVHFIVNISAMANSFDTAGNRIEKARFFLRHPRVHREEYERVLSQLRRWMDRPHTWHGRQGSRNYLPLGSEDACDLVTLPIGIPRKTTAT